MKYGIECEGRLRGLPTLFVSAAELQANEQGVHAAMLDRNLTHVYVSDRDNILDYTSLGTTFQDKIVTLDVTKVTSNSIPSNITIMLTLPYDYWESIQNLRFDDQIKFHSPNRDVLCATVRDFAYTNHTEFLNDQDL